MSVAIKIENLSKQYRLGLVSTRTLSHDLNRWWQTSILGREDPYLKIGEANIREIKGTSEYVWALRDINLEAEEGEVLGIIGKNGAGKSTLLKILSKVTAPTTGIVKARGRIASLLEVGTGFHQEMTGRENIYMNGAIMGMSKKEITRKLDEIVDFAGVERYLDTPVKRYSSGMTVRLGFSVAAYLEPEILVVDEVLAVGDAEFQKKAIGKMQDVSSKEGRTVLFVSHNMSAVKALCSTTALLGDGYILKYGKSENIVAEYLKIDKSQKEFKMPIKSKTNELQLNKLSYNRNGDDLVINMDISAKEGIPRLGVGVEIMSEDGFKIMSQGAIHNNSYIYYPRENQQITFRLENVYYLLNMAEYFITIWFSAPGVEKFIILENIIKIEINTKNTLNSTREMTFIKNGPLFIKCSLT